MRRLLMASVISLAALATACGGSSAPANDTTANQTGTGSTQATATQTAFSNSTYSIVNNSNYDIYYIYISPTSQSTWGPDQLGSDQILRSGQTLSLSGVECNNYDLKLVDEDGDECIQQNVEICQNTTLYIENDALLRCEGYQ